MSKKERDVTLEALRYWLTREVMLEDMLEETRKNFNALARLYDGKLPTKDEVRK
jgi:hypothetical protein